MKCDELKPIHVPAEMYGDLELAKGFDYYEREPVDAAIAELKDKNENLKERLHDLSIRSMETSGKVIENLSEFRAENERLKKEFRMIENGLEEMTDLYIQSQRSLWLARAERAKAVFHWWLGTTCAPATEKACNKWAKVERLCRRKAKEYK